MTEPQTSKSSPEFYAYQIRQGKTKNYWNKIGFAYAHKDGNGFNLQLDSIPKDGSICLRIPSIKN